jgi:uncharacterized RmlC-like cupin family protein
MTPPKSGVIKAQRPPQIEDTTGVIVVRSSFHETESTHGFTRTWGITSETTGTTALSMAYGTLPPGRKAEPHYHPFDTAIYTISGNARLFYGPSLEFKIDTQAGDFVFIPAWVIHTPETFGEDMLQFVVARTAPHDMYYRMGEGPLYERKDAAQPIGQVSKNGVVVE